MLKRILCFSIALVFTALVFPQHLGAPNLEPGLQNRDDILFFDDFEDQDWYTYWDRSSQPANCTLVTSPVFDGNSALKVSCDSGSHYGTSLTFDFADRVEAEPEEIYFRYYVNVPDSWNRNGGQMGKFPGISGTYGRAGWGGRPSKGYEGWSARMQNDDRDSLLLIGYYCYHADMGGTYGDNFRWLIDSLGYLKRNQWYSIECYAKMNTLDGDTGRLDGALKGWVNGQLAYEKTDLRFRHVDSLKIERIWFNIYVGGVWTATHDMELYFDNVVVARNYIGPMQEEAIEQYAYDFSEKYEVTVFPNPFNSTVEISLANGRGVRLNAPTLAIYDIHGRLMINNISKKNRFTWKSSNHPPGIYFVKISINKRSLIKKLILSK
jgi:hypothetical protein